MLLTHPAVALVFTISRHISVTRGGFYMVREIVGAVIARGVAPLIAPLAPQYATANASKCYVLA